MHILTPSSTNLGHAQIKLALQYLSKSPTAALFLANVNTTVYISHAGDTIAMPSSNQIMWNYTAALQVISADGVLGVQSPAMGLLHEFAHTIFGYNEASATAFETVVARELGEPTRASYTSIGEDVKVTNSTQHTDNGVWKGQMLSGQVLTGPYFNGSSIAPPMSNGMNPPGPGYGPPVSGGGGLPPANWGDSPGPIDTSYPIQLPPGAIPRAGNFSSDQSLLSELEVSELTISDEDLAILHFSLIEKSENSETKEVEIEINTPDIITAEIVGNPAFLD